MIPASQLRAVVVLYHPDADALEMVGALARDGLDPVVIANAIEAAALDRLSHAGIDVLVNSSNVGLAIALNQGIERALSSGAGHVILFDQDTRPAPDLAPCLLALANRVEAAGVRLGCIGPVPVDRKRPAARTLAARTGLGAYGSDLAEVATIITSGMLIPRAALEAVGGMWNELFIDQIDHEWCFRARAAGLAVLAATDLLMPHDMGDGGLEILGRYKPIHRSPIRHFYIVRNTLWLARCSFIPMRWRLVETAKLALRIPAYLLFSSARSATIGAVLRAVRQGLWPPKRRATTALPPRTTDPSTS